VSRSVSLTTALVCCLVVLSITGCGGGGYTPPPPPPPPINVSISPTFGAMDQGQSVTFTATTNDSAGKGVSWSLSGPGTLTGMTSSSTTYQAPSTVSSPAQVTLTATSITNTADFFPFGFNVVPPPMIVTSPGMPDGNVGAAYSASITTTGGTGNFTFTKTGGTIPPGLAMDNFGNFSGTPTGTPQTYNFSVKLTDASPGGNVVVPGSLSIKIDQPLPLMITTTTAPAGAVGFSYDFPIFATGGVQPYTFSLATGSSALPAGLGPLGTSNNQGVIAGTPTTAGTTSNILVQVMDSQTPPVASPPVTYSITINPSTSFIGTQAPGDIWQILISHTDATHGSFKESDQGAGGLPGTTNFSVTKAFSTTTAGFRQYVVANAFYCPFPVHCPAVFGYAVEMQGEMVLMQPGGVGTKVTGAVANSCPQLTVPTIYQFVALPSKAFSITDAAYGNVAVTQPSLGMNTYNLSFNTFRLDGTGHTSNTFPTVSCDSTFQVLSFTGTTSLPVTMAFSAHGAMVIDNGTGIPSVGLQQPASPLLTSGMNGILAGQYLGVLFHPNLAPGTLRNPGHITRMVGFGPNTGTTLTGGIYGNPGADPFSAHPADEVITLGTQTSPGLFTGGTLAIGTNPVITINNFDVVVGQVNGKFVLYGIGLDTSNSSSPQPTAVLLIQQ
jgi:hypothetical protein